MSGSNHPPFNDEMRREPAFRSPPAEIDPADERAWCVDSGKTLVAMSANELLRAISNGELSASVRVWCEGLEGWTRIRDVPEIAAHFGGFSAGARAEPETETEAELVTLPAVEIAPPAGFAPRTLAAAPQDLSQLDTPSAVPVARSVRSSEVFGVQSNQTYRKGSNTARGKAAGPMDGDDARWIGGGLLVAAAAIGMALFQAQRSTEPPPALAWAEHQLTAVEVVAHAAAAALPPSVDQATLSRTEPGQRRKRGGAGRPYPR